VIKIRRKKERGKRFLEVLDMHLPSSEPNLVAVCVMFVDFVNTVRPLLMRHETEHYPNDEFFPFLSFFFFFFML